jgi:hypothetical protein
MLGAPTWHSLGTTGAVNINKFRLGSGTKLRFGFVQAIPGGSWLQRVCIEQGFEFSLLCRASCILIAQRNQFESTVITMLFFLIYVLLYFICYSKLLFYYMLFVLICTLPAST